MNEIADHTPQEHSTHDGSDGLQRVGAALKTEREAQKLSIEEIGERLRLTPATLLAIEAGRLADLPSLTFIRGYVRSYARLLKLDEQPLLALLGEANAPVSSHAGTSRPFTAAARPRRSRLTRGKWVTRALISVAVIAVLAVGYRVAGHLFSSVPGAGQSGAPQLVLPNLSDSPSGSEAPAGTGDSLGASGGGDQPLDDEEVAPPASASPDAQTAGAAAAEPKSTTVLTIQCHKSSWVEVSVSGHKQLSEKVPAGQTRSVEGNPPFDVLIGNVEGVTVDYEGVEIDLAPFTRGKVARFTLGE